MEEVKDIDVVQTAEVSDKVTVYGRRWDSVSVVSFEIVEGKSLEELILCSIKKAYAHYEYTDTQYRKLLDYVRCKLNGTERHRSEWAHIYPKNGSVIQVYHGVRGGDNSLMGIIQVVVGAILTIVGALTSWAGGTSLMVMGIGMMITGTLSLASSLLFPVQQPNMNLGWDSGSAEPEKHSPAYSISGAKNRANINGYVPLVLGKHRHYPPLGGRSWTSWEGDKQYFHMLVVWGFPEMQVTDFKIGDTDLNLFLNVDHNFHQSTTGNDLTYFAQSYQEESVDAVLVQKEGWNTRTVGESESISLDFGFLKGLVSVRKSDGAYLSCTVRIQVQYKEHSSSEWYGFGGLLPTDYATTILTGSSQVYIYIRQSATLPMGIPVYSPAVYNSPQSSSGLIQLWPSRSSGISGCSVSFGSAGSKVRVSVGEGTYFGNPITSGSFTIDPPGFRVYVNTDGSLTVGSGAALLFPAPTDVSPPNVTVLSYNGREVSLQIEAGTYKNNGGYYDFSGSTAERTIRNVSMVDLPKAIYDVRCRRVTADSTSSYVKDECTWYTMRAITHVPAFNTPIPVCVSELRIRASEQLSGYVEEFNGMCHSKVPDWNGTTWEAKLTSNPASLMRYVLMHRSCIAKPFSASKLDGAKLIEFWEYCNSNGYQFNYICDSEKSLWERLVDITAPGRGAPTTDVDGKWGVVIDKNGKTPVQLFTPRNSWGMSVQREYAKLPDALRTSFVDETDGYVTKEGFIFNDGFSHDSTSGKPKPQDVIEWSFPGITNWEKVYAQGRMYLARALHRQLIITLNTDWEWIICHRGDLVGVSSDVLMNTFGTARINGLLYEDGSGTEVIVNTNDALPSGTIPIGVRIDDSVLFSEPSPTRYGIAIRKNDGTLFTYEIVPEYDEERDVLRFSNPISAAQIPPVGAIVSVSLLGKEYDEYLVAQISPQEDLSAQLKLIPYKVKEIEEAINVPIPPYSETVILDVVRGARFPAPIIRQLLSDESVLGGYTGASIPRIAAWWIMPRTTQNTSTLRFQLRAVDAETGATFYGFADESEGCVYVQGVQEGRVYNMSLRVLNPTTGVSSPWSAVVSHLCVGRTTPPPPPYQVFVDGTVLKITQKDRPQDVVGHVVYMTFDEEDPVEYAKQLTDTYTTTCTFDLAPWSGYARRVYVRTIDEIGLLSEPVSIAINLIDRDVKNIVFTIKERERDWPGTITNGSIQNDNLVAQEREGLWNASDNTNLWQGDDLPLWNRAIASQMSYVYNIDVPMLYSGSHLRIEPQEIFGRLYSIEYRVALVTPIWNGDDAVALWNGDDAVALWDEVVYGDWRVLPTDFVVSGGEQLQFRLTYSGGDSPTMLSDIWTVFDVPDLEWAVEDIAIAPEGTAVPIPQNYFRAITNVIATLQYRDGDTGVAATYLPSSVVVGDNGFLEQGPVLRVLDAERRATSGSLDVRLKGY